MSELVKILDDYRDAHGRPSDASIARGIGVAAQTVSSWRRRGIRDMPERETLRQLAEFVKLPYGTVLRAALLDAGWIEPGEDISHDEGESQGA